MRRSSSRVWIAGFVLPAVSAACAAGSARQSTTIVAKYDRPATPTHTASNPRVATIEEDGESELVEIARILTPGIGPTLDRAKLARVDRTGPSDPIGIAPHWDPTRLWLTAYEQEGRVVRLHGEAIDGEDVGEFLRRLATSEVFDQIMLQSSDSRSATHQFVIRGISTRADSDAAPRSITEWKRHSTTLRDPFHKALPARPSGRERKTLRADIDLLKVIGTIRGEASSAMLVAGAQSVIVRVGDVLIDATRGQRWKVLSIDARAVVIELDASGGRSARRTLPLPP